MRSHPSSVDPAYIRWRAEFEPFEAKCFAALCEFVRVQFEDLLDRYYWEGHESLHEFPAWAFERYLFEVERRGLGRTSNDRGKHIPFLRTNGTIDRLLGRLWRAPGCT